MEFILVLLVLLLLVPFFIFRKDLLKSKGIDLEKEGQPEKWKKILEDRVMFYRKLSSDEKERFYRSVCDFIRNVRISAVKGVAIDNTDRLLVASSAVIPVFSFPGWEYVNIGEVLIYDGMVQTRQKEEENKKNILGQVRPFQSKHLVLFSKQSLQNGFGSSGDRSNVGFHEFAHIIDQADGDIDGLPKAFMPADLIKPWSELMYKELACIRRGKSDINPYGLTNEAEFFAVVCEYFFENPGKFEQEHPELYALLARTFRKK
jgi:MtfA peptidase